MNLVQHWMRTIKHIGIQRHMAKDIPTKYNHTTMKNKKSSIIAVYSSITLSYQGKAW